MKNLSEEKNIKTVIITGGNTGLGYECAKNIAGDKSGNWHIVLACRNPEKAASAVKRLVNETGNKQIEAMKLDLASLDSVRSFAKDFAARSLPPLYSIVCNAGLLVMSGTTFTKDGFETTFGVNHLGHFLLINLLLKDLKSPARIVLVSSDAHDPSQKTGMPTPVFQDAELLAHPKPADKNVSALTISSTRYTTSKLCNILCAYELSRRLESEQKYREITVNTFNPGMMPGSGLGGDSTSLLMRLGWHYILPALRFFGVKFNGMKLWSVDESGKALARLVTDSRLATVTGKYFDGESEIPSSEESYDRQKAVDLWEKSAELVKLAPEETILSKIAKSLPLNDSDKQVANNQPEFSKFQPA